MDEDEVMEVEETWFEAYEVDLDYEFDAVRFFDFTRQETQAEARCVEAWFHSARSYPPSPFVTRMIMGEEILQESFCSSLQSKEGESLTTSLDDHSDTVLSAPNVNTNGTTKGSFSNICSDNLQNVQSLLSVFTTGSISCNKKAKNQVNPKTKFSAKNTVSRSSTLMKPTASQLAKQNRPHGPPQVAGFRSQTYMSRKKLISFCNSPIVESQAPKRQKLEGGQLVKVDARNQQTNLVHKVPKKDGIFETSCAHPKMKITIPVEPNFKTVHRAQRQRPKIGAEPDCAVSTMRHFKARPLNKKIFEAPSLPVAKKSTPKVPEFQVFHLKTQERAMQYTSAIASPSFHCNDSAKEDKACYRSVAKDGNSQAGRPSTAVAQKHDGCDAVHNFKARPLNRKIFASKGDLGVFRNTKRETTVPIEFNFRSEKRIQQNLPIELFTKLSLKSESQPNSGSQFKTPRPTSTSLKGSKENRVNNTEPRNESTLLVKEKSHTFGAEVGNYYSSARSLLSPRNPSWDLR